ncbi:MAG: hypothetical protein GX181_01330 [Synergistaceae bacterium]|nr:hypothetical protein [Synergistota bacterium]NLM70588.1 hypothetical protein [Synergistaceae bacterium]
MSSSVLRSADRSATADALLFYYPAVFLLFFADIPIVDFPEVRIGLLDILPKLEGISWPAIGIVFAVFMLIATIRYVAGGGESDLWRVLLRGGHAIIVTLSFIGFLFVPVGVTLTGMVDPGGVLEAFASFRGAFFFLTLFVMSGMSHAYLAEGRTDTSASITDSPPKLIAAQMAMLSAAFLFLVLEAPGTLPSLLYSVTVPHWVIPSLPIVLALTGALFSSFGGGREHAALLALMLRLCALLSLVAPVVVLIMGRAEESGMALYMASLALFVSSVKGVDCLQDACGGGL